MTRARKRRNRGSRKLAQVTENPIIEASEPEQGNNINQENPENREHGDENKTVTNKPEETFEEFLQEMEKHVQDEPKSPKPNSPNPGRAKIAEKIPATQGEPKSPNPDSSKPGSAKNAEKIPAAVASETPKTSKETRTGEETLEKDSLELIPPDPNQIQKGN